jgi:hypothetical protein
MSSETQALTARLPAKPQYHTRLKHWAVEIGQMTGKPFSLNDLVVAIIAEALARHDAGYWEVEKLSRRLAMEKQEDGHFVLKHFLTPHHSKAV